MRSKFKYHAVITGTFIRFLTRQTAESSTAVLGTKMKYLETKVSTLTSTSATNIQHNKMDAKVEAVTNVDNLKKSDWRSRAHVQMYNINGDSV